MKTNLPNKSIFGAALMALSLLTSCQQQKTPVSDATPESPKTSTASAPVYPVKVSANHRYLVDQNNTPFLIVGDTPQGLISRLNEKEIDAFWADRQAHGFNTMGWVDVLCGGRDFITNTYATTPDGIRPFTAFLHGKEDHTEYDLSKPNEPYFVRLDHIVELAAKHNLLIFIDPIETAGWLQTLRNNGVKAATAYGEYLGNRYKKYPNIAWLNGNDFHGWQKESDDALVRAVAKGIKSVDPDHIQTVEFDPPFGSSLDDPSWSAIIAINGAYVYGPTYLQVLHNYNQTPVMPIFLMEAHYELEDVGHTPDYGTPLVLRREEYWAMLSGGKGQFYGNKYTWSFKDGWQNNIDTPGATQVTVWKDFFSSLPWQDLVPDQDHSVVTAGFGTPGDMETRVSKSDYATTSKTPDGGYVVVYMPSSRMITVNMTNLKSNADGKWFDPSNGAYTSIAGSPFANKGTQQFTPPGNNHAGDSDWVLVLGRLEMMRTAALILLLLGVGANAQTISIDPANPHYYFFHGKPVVLVTSAEHYGAVVNSEFDYVKYLDALQAYGLNYTRIYPGYLFEPMGKYMPGNTLGVKPAKLILPWARSNQTGYLLSGNKFDLDQWNPAYFDRLKDFITQAGKRGIVVEICFFNAQYDDTWPLSPLYHENNIQAIGRDDYKDAQTLKEPALVEREAAYVRKIVQEVNGFDNVILEVCDEPSNFTPIEEAGPWVGHMLEVTHGAEASLPKKHLIGQEVQGPVDGPIDFSGNGFISIVVTQYLWRTGHLEMGGLQGLDREYRHNKPIEQNETNYYPLYKGDKIGASRVEAWEFMVGGGAGFNQLNGLFTPDDPTGNTPENAKLLGALRSLKTFIESFSFDNMVPDRGFVVSGFDRATHYRGLSQYGKQYALYIHHSEGGEDHAYTVTPGQYRENLVLNLPPGNYKAEWIDPATYSTLATEDFEQTGALHVIDTPTYSIDIALRIKRQ